MTLNSAVRTHSIQPVDPIWTAVRDEAADAVANDPILSAFLYATILNQDSLEAAVIHRISERLDHRDVSADLIRHTFNAMVTENPTWSVTVRADIQAYFDRDPACDRFFMPILYFKGFHAIQTHRLAHWLWSKGRRDFALYLQSRSSSILQTDIHPASKMGQGVFIDHATGLVVGETAVIEDDVSILHGVTLGGTGKAGRRPPSQDPARGADRRRRQNPRQYRDRPLLACGGRLGGARLGAQQQDGRRRAGKDRRRDRLRQALAAHGSQHSSLTGDGSSHQLRHLVSRATASSPTLYTVVSPVRDAHAASQPAAPTTEVAL